MPIEFQDRTFSSGEVYLYVHGSGVLSVAECEGLVVQINRPLYGGKPKILSYTAKDTQYPTDVRKYFRTVKFEFRAWATVLPSPLIRATTNFLMRLSPNNIHLRVFKAEPEAIEWLEQHGNE